MKYPMIVEIFDGRRQLKQQGLGLGRQEGLLHFLLQGLEVVFKKVHDQEDVVESIADNDFAQVHDVSVLCRHEALNLPQARDWKSILLTSVHLEFLESHDLAGRDISCP